MKRKAKVEFSGIACLKHGGVCIIRGLEKRGGSSDSYLSNILLYFDANTVTFVL